jgi:hypothetical protein
MRPLEPRNEIVVIKKFINFIRLGWISSPPELMDN